jgi:hypothetical protein
MAQRDAEHSGVGGERRCPAEHVHGPACRHSRGSGEPTAERGVASQRPEAAPGDDQVPTGARGGAGGSGCRADRPGWVGAHRHGGVRPGTPTIRRLRPPGRWC